MRCGGCLAAGGRATSHQHQHGRWHSALERGAPLIRCCLHPKPYRQRRCQRYHRRASGDADEWRQPQAPSVSLSSSASRRLGLRLSPLNPAAMGSDSSINGTSTHLVPVPRFGLAYLVRSSRLRPEPCDYDHKSTTTRIKVNNLKHTTVD
jgi:hypothetical protein